LNLMTEQKKKVEVVFENRLYDLTKFCKVHPGGSQIIEDFNGCDATDHFYALHSNAARKMLKNMPSVEVPEEDKVPQSDYLKTTFELEKAGKFDANPFVEALLFFHAMPLFIAAFYFANSYPTISACCLGIGMLTLSWSAHMWEHQRNNILGKVSAFTTPFFAGISPNWWSTKHNRHHVSTNEILHDSDIQLFPFIYLWKPKKSEDSWNRGLQHIYFSALYSIITIKWQIDSVMWAVKYRRYSEVAYLALHWAVKLTLPWRVWVLAVLITGTIIGWVVTASHQAEDKVFDKREFVPKGASKYQINDYMYHQLITTRGIRINSWIIHYLCGGMQFQIEHHIFPRMPLYRLPWIQNYVKQYCKDHNIDYKEDDLFDITKRNFENIETFAKVKIE